MWKKKDLNKKIQKAAETEVTTFPVPFSLAKIKNNISISTNTIKKLSKGQIINHAIHLHLKGNIVEATKYYKKIISQGCDDHRIFSYYGVILKNQDNLQEAELSLRQSIKLNPNNTEAHFNLGSILIDLGNLKNAELSTLKAIDIKRDFLEDFGIYNDPESGLKSLLSILKPNGYIKLGLYSELARAHIIKARNYI